MSEPQAQPRPYIASGLEALAIECQFKDGAFPVPDWVIAQLGGKDEFERVLRPALHEFTYAEFMQAHMSEASKQHLNKLGRTIINQHFNRINNPWQ